MNNASEMTVCSVKGVACSEKLTKNHHLALHFPSALRNFSVFQLIVLQPATSVQSHYCYQPCFQPQQSTVSSDKALINPLYTTKKKDKVRC